MYINFENDKTVYSFTDKELRHIKDLYDTFQQYGEIDLNIIHTIIKSKFIITKLIPLFYKIKNGILKNVEILLDPNYIDFLLHSKSLYTEFGLLIKTLLSYSSEEITRLPLYIQEELSYIHKEIRTEVVFTQKFVKVDIVYHSYYFPLIDESFLKHNRPLKYFEIYEKPINKLKNESFKQTLLSNL